MRKLLLITSTFALLTACDLSPDYALPTLSLGDAFKEEKPATASADAAKNAAPNAAAIPAASSDEKWQRVDEKAKINETAWWRMFNLSELNALEEQAMKDNPSLDIVAQRLAAARATAGISDSNLYPTVTAGFGPERQKPAAANINGSFPSPVPIQTKPYTTYTAQGVITYELDLFGKNRLTARAAARDADAEENNYRAARLTLQADLAQTYFGYLALKKELALLTRTRDARTESLTMIRNKFEVGAVDDVALASAQTELATTEGDRAAVAQQCAAQEHTLAILLGVTPAQFTAPTAELTGAPPIVPAGLPSRLLERRPDIQAATNSIAAANARIGAARAGYFPDISLSAVGGYASGELHDLFKKPNQFWALGPIAGGTILTQPLFEGGLLSATLDERKAEYEAASAGYRVAVLQAFREVEDSLSNLHALAEQAAAREAASTAAKRAYSVATERYKVGYSGNLEYLDAERQLLAVERSDVEVEGQRYVAAVQLIKALGGSWEAVPATAPEEKSATPAVSTPSTAPQEPEAAQSPAETAPVTEEKPWYHLW